MLTNLTKLVLRYREITRTIEALPDAMAAIKRAAIIHSL